VYITVFNSNAKPPQHFIVNFIWKICRQELKSPDTVFLCKVAEPLSPSGYGFSSIGSESVPTDIAMFPIPTDMHCLRPHGNETYSSVFFSSSPHILGAGIAQSVYLLATGYTECFTTWGHNCRRWFPRSLWSKNFILTCVRFWTVTELWPLFHSRTRPRVNRVCHHSVLVISTLER
jgi:hypothetical protein